MYFQHFFLNTVPYFIIFFKRINSVFEISDPVEYLKNKTNKKTAVKKTHSSKCEYGEREGLRQANLILILLLSHFSCVRLYATP